MRLPARGTQAAGFVLAGGASSRMGRDKALVTLGGRPLIEWALGTLRAAGLPVTIAGARGALGRFGPVIEDRGRGPLDGICAGLRSLPAETRLAVFLPVDLPLLPPALITALLEDAGRTGAVVTLTGAGGFAETFPAVVARGALAALESSLEAGEGGCFAAFGRAAAAAGERLRIVPAESLLQAGAMPEGELPAAKWWLNVNRPGDLEQAEALVSGGKRVS